MTRLFKQWYCINCINLIFIFSNNLEVKKIPPCSIDVLSSLWIFQTIPCLFMLLFRYRKDLYNFFYNVMFFNWTNKNMECIGNRTFSLSLSMYFFFLSESHMLLSLSREYFFLKIIYPQYLKSNFTLIILSRF